MTLEQKVSQLFIVTPEAISGASPVTYLDAGMRDALATQPVGGLIFFAGNVVDAGQTSQMLGDAQAAAQGAVGLPLFLCIDEEGGQVSRIGGNAGFGIANVGSMSSVGLTGDVEYAYAVGQTIGSYLRDLGFNVDFAPVADIANSDSQTMADRSFGASADLVASMVSSQVGGLADSGVMCCVKHFPGIGAAYGDSHETGIYSAKTVEQMDAEELIPFRAAIEKGVPLVMVGHLTCPGVSDDGLPASLSPAVTTGVLRDRLGFDGLIVTDSLSMGAVTSIADSSTAAVMALRAGADLLLMPLDFWAAYDAVLSAVASGDIAESRIDESVRRIVAAKVQYLM